MFPPKTRFLIIDDMPVIRELVKSHLEALGFSDITEAKDGEEAFLAIVKADQEKRPFEVIISDWNMPKMNGLELLKQIRASEKYKHVPFILLTSESEKDQVTEAVLAGVSHYIVKPFQPKALEDKLKAVWAKISRKP